MQPEMEEVHQAAGLHGAVSSGHDGGRIHNSTRQPRDKRAHYTVMHDREYTSEYEIDNLEVASRR